MEEFRRHKPDVTLMDQSLPDGSGTDALTAIREEYPEARIIIFTTAAGDGDIRRAMRAGASAYVIKTAPKNELLEIIRSVHSGKKRMPADVASRLAEHFTDEELTPRELDILRLIQDGFRNKQIAAKLFISEATVNFHIRNLVGKLHANDRTHAVTLAVRRVLLPA